MDRKLAIMLSLCLGIVCAFVNWFGKSFINNPDASANKPTVVTCHQLLESWPKDNFHLLLTEFQRGRKLVSRDANQDDNWERVYVPLFPAHLKSLGNNYNSVIVYFDDVKNEAELDARLASDKLDSQLWYTQQKLPDGVHSDLAQRYRLMDLSRSVVLQGGFRPPNQNIGKYAVLGSYLGMIASGIIFAWNLIAMLLPKRRPHNFFNDEDESPIQNRAGLPEFD